MNRSVRRLLLLLLGLAITAAACSVAEALPPPGCQDGGSSIIVAQSVPTAELIPCLEPLPTGWSVVSTTVVEDHSAVRFNSDRAGEDAAVLRIEASCDTTTAVGAPSDIAGADRFDEIERLEPGFRARRYYVFPGGCVWWRFDFDNDASATEAVAIGNTLSFVSREAANESIRETFIDEEL